MRTFVAVSVDTVSWYTKNLESFYEGHDGGHAAMTRDTALRLFPRFANARGVMAPMSVTAPMKSTS
jgi:hypothetical protein